MIIKQPSWIPKPMKAVFFSHITHHSLDEASLMTNLDYH